MERSPFRWIDLFGTGSCWAATGFNGFAIVADLGHISAAIVKRNMEAIYLPEQGRVRLVSVGTLRQAMAAADDFLRTNEDGDSAKKTKRWLNDRVSEKQRDMLNRYGIHVGALDFSWTKYKAACMLNYVWNKQYIDGIIQNIIQKESA